jgi:undecaprenyl-diphosphatase
MAPASLLVWLDGVERDLMHCITCKLYVPWLDTLLLEAQEKTVFLPVVVAVIAALACFRPRRALRVLVAGAAAWGIAMLVASAFWFAIDRPRPPQAYARVLETPEEIAACEADPDALPLRKHRSRSPSFPSRHALTVGVFVAVFWLASWPLGVIAALWGLLVVVGRVYAAKHWPTDVLAGVLLGLPVGWLVYRGLPAALDRLGLGRWVREPPPPGTPAPQ